MASEGDVLYRSTFHDLYQHNPPPAYLHLIVEYFDRTKQLEKIGNTNKSLPPERYEEETRRKVKEFATRLEGFADKPWFKDFMEAIMTPTILMAEGFDKLIAKAQDRFSSNSHE